MYGRSSSRHAAIKYHGLQNQGATCYLNSVLQVLFMTKDFRKAVIRYGGKCVSFQTPLRNLFEKLEKGETTTWSITDRLGIRSGSIQGDAAECFEKIMNSLNSLEASQMFKIWLAHKNVCDGCQMERSTDEQFWHLPLELVEDSNRAFKVDDAIDKFFIESKVTGQDQLYCEGCRVKTDSHDKHEIKDHPGVLTLLLKRFMFSQLWQKYVKVNRRVQIPNTITIQSQKYDLYALVEHRGDLKVGHYTATIKSEDNEKWYHFNDTTVHLLAYDPFQLDPSYGSRDAYLLFYRREKRTSPQDEASCPAAAKLQTCVVNDPSGNAVKTEEKEDEEAAADRNNVRGSEGQSATVDEEREEETLIQGKIVSRTEDRITIVDELRGVRKTPTDVEEEATGREAADDREPAGGQKTLLKKSDLVHSRHLNITSETKLEEEKREGQFRAQQHRRGHEETYSEHPLSRESEGRREIQRGDELAQTRKNSQRNSSRTVENQIQSDGVCQTRPQDDLKEETWTRDVSVKRHINEGEETRENVQSKQWKGETGGKVTAVDKRDLKAADVESVSDSLSNMKVGDSTSAERRDKDTQAMHINVTFPSTMDTRRTNTGDFDWQTQLWVSNLVCGNCLSVLGTIETDIYSHTQTFTSRNHSHFVCCEPESAENHVRLPRRPVQTTGPPRTPPQPHVSEGQHTDMSNGRRMPFISCLSFCKRRTGHSYSK